MININKFLQNIFLHQDKFCPAVFKETAKILKRAEIVDYFKNNQDLMKNLSDITSSSISESTGAGILHNTLLIEMANNYTWPVWTEEEERNILKRLQPVVDYYFKNNWDSPIIKRLRAGGLVRELNKNYQKVLDKSNDKKVYVYSTHDTMLAALMAALNISNGLTPPFGASIYFELHQDQARANASDHGYFVRVFYHNETLVENTGVPHSVSWGDCQGLTDCPVNRYLDSTKHLLYDDFNKECKLF